MPTRARTRTLAAFLVVAAPLAAAAPAPAQDDARLRAMASWVAVDASTGYETRVTPGMAEAMDGWTSDRWGNLVSVVGSGGPRRIVACALDRPSYAASQITADGYLRVHRIGRGSGHPLWDQAFEAQPVRVLTRNGPVAGVVARSNGHFAAQHRHETAVVGPDDLWADVGAESAEEVVALGIELLDPITRHLPPWPMAGGVAGPDAGRRVGCAAVATLAAVARDGRTSSGEIHFVMSSQEVLGWVGLSSYVARGGSFDQMVVVAPGEAQGGVRLRPADSFGRFGTVLETAEVDEVTWIVPAVRSPGSHMEQVRLEDATTLLDAAAVGADMDVDPEVDWAMAPEPAPLRMGNVMVEAVRTTHADDPSLNRTAALLHFDPPGAPSALTGTGDDTSPRWKAESLTASAPPPIPGVFLTRDIADRKNVDSERAWFGMDAEALAARGVRAGMAVTMYKEGLRLGRHRFVARALDDRAGTTALLLAISAIDPDELDSKVIFTWSVHEEGGLRGAGAMARRFARSAHRIFSVDTFVSSDTPLESPHFAHAMLGSGPVLRAIENSSVSPDRERQRVIRAAREAGIPLQIGLTQGGTDGTQFTFWGAPNQGLSWPGRYSHSPGEVLDLRDLTHLAELIAAVARVGG